MAIRSIRDNSRMVLCGKFALLGLALIPSGCGILPPLETVATVDSQRYLGTWYEIARYPNFFQVDCVNTTAEYTLNPDGSIRVVNRCTSQDGQNVQTIVGRATAADSTNAKLWVTFFEPFAAPYWIIDLDPDYQFAVVSEPTRTTAWILARTPSLDPDTYAAILARASAKGIDPARQVPTPQNPATP